MDAGVRHPIDDGFLMGYAAGLLPAAYDLMVASAVSLDDGARVRLSGFEAMGGALFDAVEVAPLHEDSFVAVMARIRSADCADTVHSDSGAPRRDAVLPQPLREAFGGDVDDLRWRRIGMGVRQVVLAHGDDGAAARLLSIPAGQAMPDHGHDGTEITLVLQGAFTDGDVRYARGDVEVADDDVRHRPVAAHGEACVCFVVTDAPLRFDGLIPRIAQKFLNI